MRELLVVPVALVLLTACGKHYWTKPGADFSQFARDSEACARQSAAFSNTDRTAGIVNTKAYRYCLKSLGWNRGQQVEPVPVGWFRGFEEDEEVVKLDQPPEQPTPATPAPAPARGDTSNFGGR
jgi:hypothetical protein